MGQCHRLYLQKIGLVIKQFISEKMLKLIVYISVVLLVACGAESDTEENYKGTDRDLSHLLGNQLEPNLILVDASSLDSIEINTTFTNQIDSSEDQVFEFVPEDSGIISISINDGSEFNNKVTGRIQVNRIGDYQKELDAFIIQGPFSSEVIAGNTYFISIETDESSSQTYTLKLTEGNRETAELDSNEFYVAFDREYSEDCLEIIKYDYAGADQRGFVFNFKWATYGGVMYRQTIPMETEFVFKRVSQANGHSITPDPEVGHFTSTSEKIELFELLPETGEVTGSIIRTTYYTYDSGLTDTCTNTKTYSGKVLF